MSFEWLANLWGGSHFDADGREWESKYTNATQLLVHVTDPRAEAIVETFDSRNRGGIRTIDVATRLQLQEQQLILVIMALTGNGRINDGSEAESPVGFGRYQSDMAEGGVIDAVRTAFRWSRGMNVVGLKLLNEQDTPDTWYRETVAHVARIRDRERPDCKLIIGGDPTDVAAAADYADVVDVHLLGPTWRSDLAAYAGFGLPLFASEVASIDRDGKKCTPIDVMYSELVALQDADPPIMGVGCFVGNRMSETGRKWNFRTFDPPFTCLTKHGETLAGRAWREYILPAGSDDMYKALFEEAQALAARAFVNVAGAKMILDGEPPRAVRKLKRAERRLQEIEELEDEE